MYFNKAVAYYMYQLSSSVNEETYVFGAIQTELSLASKKINQSTCF